MTHTVNRMDWKVLGQFACSLGEISSQAAEMADVAAVDAKHLGRPLDSDVGGCLEPSPHPLLKASTRQEKMMPLLKSH
ncbi:hypothetical protein AGIG_G1434 [Arapaima gigas]